LFLLGQSPPRVDEQEGNNRDFRSAASKLFASATVTHAARLHIWPTNLGQNLLVVARHWRCSKVLVDPRSRDFKAVGFLAHPIRL
jgi:hypothetical protein